MLKTHNWKRKRQKTKNPIWKKIVLKEKNQASHSANYTKRAAYQVSQPHAECDLRAVWPKLLSSAPRNSTWAQRQVGWHALHYWWQIFRPGGRVRSKALAEVAGKRTESQPSLRVSEIFSVGPELRHEILKPYQGKKVTDWKAANPSHYQKWQIRNTNFWMKDRSEPIEMNENASRSWEGNKRIGKK